LRLRLLTARRTRVATAADMGVAAGPLADPPPVRRPLAGAARQGTADRRSTTLG